ncbi:MAG: AAA family ATPase, partial [Candidatus Acidiferrales bacterium]
MILDFYKLQERPFGFTPDLRFLYLSASHRKALDSLCQGITDGRGLLALIAPPGTGKSTMLLRLLEHVRESARTSILLQTPCHSNKLLSCLLTELGLEPHAGDLVATHERLKQVLLREKGLGKRFVLLIDDSQNLSGQGLETVRLLSEFETPTGPLLQIVLAGRPELAEKLLKPGLAQLRQRISLVVSITPMSKGEVSDYVENRLRVAGHTGGGIFTPAALDRIAEFSHGIPHNINALCLSSLSLGFAVRHKWIDAGLVDQVAADLNIDSVADMIRRDARMAAKGAPIKRAALTRRTVRPVPIYRGIERTQRIQRLAVVACVFLVTLLAAMVYREDIKMAFAQTRKTPATSDIGLLSRQSAAIVEIGSGTSNQPPAMNSINERRGSAPPTRASDPHTSPANEQPKRAPAIRQVKHTASADLIFPRETTAVIVHPNDDLRQICLRYIGSYNTQLVNEIRVLNPELTDPDRIAVGQRLALPLPVA